MILKREGRALDDTTLPIQKCYEQLLSGIERSTQNGFVNNASDLVLDAKRLLQNTIGNMP